MTDASKTTETDPGSPAPASSRLIGPEEASERLTRGLLRHDDDDQGLGDRELAFQLVESVSQNSISGIGFSLERQTEPRNSSPAEPKDADHSFLGLLEGEGLKVAQIAHLPTVLSIARAGRAHQKRAAVEKLGRVLRDKGASREELRRITEYLEDARDVEFAYELSSIRSTFSGATGKQANAERVRFDVLTEQLRRQIAQYWDGALGQEPVMNLPGGDRALIMIRVRDLPDVVVAHISAVLQGGEELVDKRTRLDLLGSIRYSGDPRLVAPLVAVSFSRDRSLATEAALALSSIRDPRVHPALVSCFSRAVDGRHLAVLAGALGRVGDNRGAEDVRKALGQGALDRGPLTSMLEALSSVGGPEDALLLLPFLEHSDHDVKLTAVRAVGKLGDRRVVSELRSLASQTTVSAVRAEVEDAVAAIQARLELLGEDTDMDIDLDEADPRPGRRSTLVTTGTGAQLAPIRRGARISAARHFGIGWLWFMVGAKKRGIGRMERAAEARPNWASPLIAIAMAHARKEDDGRALSNFRRAVEADRTRVEQGPLVIRELARCFLRRAEEIAREGRHGIAAGLLDEVVALDLRLAPEAVRFEIDRLHDALRRRGAP